MLPKTPPADNNPGPLLPTRALSLLRNPSVLVLSAVAIPVATIHTAYYLNIGPFLSSVVGIPLKWVGPTLALAQLSEVFCLLALGPCLKRFGYLRILLFGIGAQAGAIHDLRHRPARLGRLHVAHAARDRLRLLLHDATLYIEHMCDPSVRHSTQTVFGLVLFGIGPALRGRTRRSSTP